MIVSCICCLPPLEVHLLPSRLTSPKTLLLEKLERHTSTTMMRKRVVLLTLSRVIGVAMCSAASVPKAFAWIRTRQDR